MTDTTITPAVTSTVTGAPAGLFTPTGGFVLSEDLDRMPYGILNVDAIVAPANYDSVYLDPRSAPRTLVSSLTIGPDTIPTSLYLRSVNYTDKLAGLATLNACTWEIGFEDRFRQATTPRDTAAANLQALVNWARADNAASIPGFPAAIAGTAPLAAIALPAGDRRQWMPGQKLSQLYEAELQAQGGRIRGTLAGGLVYESANSPVTLVATVLDAEGITSLTQKLARDGDWYDGILAKFQYLNGSGVLVTAFQGSGTGTHTRATQVVEERVSPPANVADQIVARTKRRGNVATIAMPISLDPALGLGRVIDVVKDGSGLMSGQIRARTLRLPEGTMTLTVVAA